MASSTKEIKKALPQPNSDFYQLVETLPTDELAVLKQVRTFMETKVAPIITKYWVEDSFPFELLPAIKELNIGGVAMNGYGCRGGSAQLFGLIAMEMARVDSSISTFFGVHNGLAMGSIFMGGSEEQKQKWLPLMARWEKIGCFGLTEPLVGSGTSGGLTTTAKRDGDTWILNGQKKWIGNSPWCDISIIWARDLADNQVKAFIVENKTTPGFKVDKIQNKIALKVVQNGLITMENCRVPRHSPRPENDAIHGRLGGNGMRHGRLRKCGQVLPGAFAVRQAHRLIPDGARPPGQDARQHHRFAMPLGTHVPVAGRKQDD
jgi:alkylation response protein AidB-like acyl-CoA dehydrogenase